MSTKIVGYHHKGDLDGLTSGWVLKKHHPKAELVGVDHHLPNPEFVKNSVVYVMDYVFDLEVMEDLIASNKLVVLLDHHPKAKEVADVLVQRWGEDRFLHSVDFSLSGCELTWEFLAGGVQAPDLVKMVGDLDLWKFEIPETKGFVEGLMELDFTMDNWDWACTEEGTHALLERGTELALERVERCRQQIATTKERLSLIVGYSEDGEEVRKEVPITNVAVKSDSSEQTSMMIKAGMGDIVMARYVDGKRTHMRITTSPEGPHAGEIAKLYGGGGHAHVAGFHIDME